MTYPYIAAWGHLMGSFAYYIKDETQRAIESQAPRSAIFRQFPTSGGEWDGTSWAVAEDITGAETRITFARICAELGVPVPMGEMQ